MSVRDYLSGKSVMVTGGTGSFGYQIVSELVRMAPSEIIIASRDEKKQYDMANHFSEYRGLVSQRLVDVRDYDRVRDVMHGVQVVFHAAALKQVPHCELQPLEAVKTNILGAENVRRAAIDNGVEAVVSVSTDKAVKPVNAMGMTKAIQEKIMLSSENSGRGTKFVCVRYGNVLGSRGSVVPYFAALAIAGRPLPITHHEMTRFMLTLPEAVDLVFYALLNGNQGDLYVKKMPACRVTDIAEVIGRRLGGAADYPKVVVGIRPGEKMHEVLVSEEEMRRAEESADHYRILPPHSPSKIERQYPEPSEYTSRNTRQLSVAELENLLDREQWLSREAVALKRGLF